MTYTVYCYEIKKETIEITCDLHSIDILSDADIEESGFPENFFGAEIKKSVACEHLSDDYAFAYVIVADDEFANACEYCGDDSNYIEKRFPVAVCKSCLTSEHYQLELTEFVMWILSSPVSSPIVRRFRAES